MNHRSIASALARAFVEANNETSLRRVFFVSMGCYPDPDSHRFDDLWN